MTIAKVTKKDTKDVIWGALQDALTKLKDAENKKVDPAKEVAEKKKTETIQKADETASLSINQIVENLQGQVAGALESVSSLISEQSGAYANLEDAIAIKKAELEELFGIETNCFTLTALINSQNEMKDTFNANMAAEKAAARKEFDDVLELIKGAMVQWQNELKAMNAERDQNRKREEDEYLYDLKRNRKIVEDKFKDDMDNKKKVALAEIEDMKAEVAADLERVQEREVMVFEREKTVKSLEAQVASFPQEKQAAVEAAIAETKKKEADSFGFKERYMKKEFEGERALQDAKIANLETTVVDQKETIADLKSKLDEAYREMKDMATKTIEGASNSKTIATLENALKDKSSK